MKFPAQPQKESPSTGDAALSKIQFVFNQQWHGDFLDEVRVTGSLRPLDFRNFRRQQSFRAHCILMVLAKYAWEISPDKEAVTDSEGKLSFSVKSPKDTWIYTLAQFYRRNPNGGMFTQALKKPKFIWSSRGTVESGGDQPPAVGYISKIFSPDTFQFFLRSSQSPLAGEQLLDCAADLEKGGDWKIKDTVEQLFLNYRRNPQAQANQSNILAVQITARKRQDFVETIRDIVCHVAGNSYDEEKTFAIVKRRLRDYPVLSDFPLTVDGDTLLLLAIGYGHKKLTRFLLKDSGLNVNRQNTKGVSPLLKAAMHNDFSAIKALIKRGADVLVRNNQGANAIYESAFGAGDESLEIIKAFAKLGVPPLALCRDGSTTLSVAMNRRAPADAIRYLLSEHSGLLEAGKNPYQLPALLKIGDEQETQAKFIELATKVKARLREPMGAPPPPSFGTSEFFLAALNADLDYLDHTINCYKPQLDYVDPVFGTSALHLAAQNLHLKIVSRIIDAGPNPFVQDFHGRTPREVLPHKIMRNKRAPDEKSPRLKVIEVLEEELRTEERIWAGHPTFEVNLLF